MAAQGADGVELAVASPACDGLGGDVEQLGNFGRSQQRVGYHGLGHSISLKSMNGLLARGILKLDDVFILYFIKLCKRKKKEALQLLWSSQAKNCKISLCLKFLTKKSSALPN